MEAARLLESSDLERARELFAGAVEELGAQRGAEELLGEISQGLGADLFRAEGRARVLEDPPGPVWVGLLSGVVVGFAVIRIREVESSGARIGVLEILYVEPEARCVGIGEALMSAARTWCSEQACTALEAPALPGGRAAKSFLEAAGFRARLLVMSTTVGTASGEEMRSPGEG